MADIPHSRSNSLHSSVSREFSDSELTLQNDVENHINAPKFQTSGMAPTATAYAILREDLKMRAMQNAELGQRQRIAFADSARTQLNDDAVRRNTDNAAAQEAITELGALINEQGMPADDAFDHMVRKDPRLAMNSFFLEPAKVFGALVLDPHEKFMKKHGEEVDQMGLLTKKFDAQAAYEEGKMRMEDMPAYIDMLKRQKEAGKTAFSNEEMQGKIDQIELQHDYLKARDTGQRIEDAFHAGGRGGVNSEVRLQVAGNIFREMGMPGFKPNLLIQSVRPSGPYEFELRALGDPKTLDRLADSDDRFKSGREVAAHLNVLGNETTIRKAAEGDKTAIESLEAARGTLQDAAGLYFSTYERQIENQKVADRLEKVKAGLSKSYTNAIKEIREDIVVNFTDDHGNPDPPKLGDYKSAQARAAAFASEIVLTQGDHLSLDQIMDTIPEPFVVVEGQVLEDQAGNEKEVGDLHETPTAYFNALSRWMVDIAEQTTPKGAGAKPLPKGKGKLAPLRLEGAGENSDNDAFLGKELSPLKQ